MKITLLGTNGWFDNENGQTMCTLIQTEDYSVILDAGYGIRKCAQLIDCSKPVIILLSHLHLDHTVGLHTMPLFNFLQPLKIIVPETQKEVFRMVATSTFSDDWTNVKSAGTLLYDTGELDAASLPFGLETLPLCHPVPVQGYRLQVEGKVISYLCDTGYCGNAVKLAQDADLVVSECGALPGTAQPGGPHMDPETCARLAVEANVRRMVLTHFGAGSYPTIASRKNAVNPARSIYPGLITGVDDLEIIL